MKKNSSQKKQPFLKACNLTKSYQGRFVVHDFSFEIYPGEIVGILGPNGAGKTTAFYMATGLITPDKGQVFLNSKNVTKLAMHKRARLGLGYLAQESTLFSQLTVEENILIAVEPLEKQRSKRKELVEVLLEELHLGHLKNARSSSLSGGEKRRLEISRALAANPSGLMLDEPFANVDPIAVHEVQELIIKLKKKNIAILITDHNVREIFSITDRCYLLNEGKKLAEGTTEMLLANKEVREHYLGRQFSL